MEKYIFTDLACEISGDRKEESEFISDRIEKKFFYRVADGQERRHVTFFTPRIWLLEDNEYDLLKCAIAEELRVFLNRCVKGGKRGRILAVGLGNPRLTPDSLGALTVERLQVSPPTEEDGGFMAITPDVSGNTGIDTLDAVSAYVEGLRPDAVIAIDSLRARGYERLASTVQLSDGGIAPGGGVGRGGGRLSESTLGVPIISIGVPTVVSASTIVYDALSRWGEPLELADKKSILSVLDGGRELFVMPKEADILIKWAALLLSDAINLSM